MRRQEIHADFQPKTLKEIEHLGDLGIGDRMMLKWMLKKQSVRTWTGFICLGTKSSGRLL
jgi:hypothetical protein